MKKSKLILNVLKRTGAIHLLYAYIVLFLSISFVICIFDPGVQTFRDSTWYCFSVMTTIGFGDIVVTTAIAKIASIILSIFSILLVAIIPGVLTSYYLESIKFSSNESMEKFLNDLENLPDLSKEELEKISERIKEFKKSNKL